MITLAQYVGPHAQSKDWTFERQKAAMTLLDKVNALCGEMQSDGLVMQINPATRSQISGKTLGGFRPQDATQGAPNSSHKQGQGIDLFDPKDTIDAWCVANQERLANHGIYIEHPDATKGWCHMTTRAPRSGNRVFMP
jgi:hypothetical protein